MNRHPVIPGGSPETSQLGMAKNYSTRMPIRRSAITRPLDHDDLSSLGKPIVREAFADQLNGLLDSAIAKGVRLQKGGRVDELFRTLLANPDINRFETSDTTISALCQRWGREVEANPAAFAAGIGGIATPAPGQRQGFR